MSSLLDSSQQKQFLKFLLSWYQVHGRHDMPWRKTKDPYAIVVSEFMLQQTTVSAVRPYYERFLKKFPTLASLADGDLNDVLALWSGLGYYARARNLWAAMRGVQQTFHGKIPSDAEKLQKLPGIGSYTSGAIASFAFNKPAIVLDGNIIRVLMRVLALEEDPRLKAVQVLLRKTVFDLTVQSQRGTAAGKRRSGPRHAVLALMDLGATVCLPDTPLCGQCPISKICLARAYGKQAEIPAKQEKMERPTVRRLFAAIEHKGKWLFGQRPHDGSFGGLWEFVGVDMAAGLEPVPFLEENAEAELGFPIRVEEAIPGFEHQLTHRIFLVRPFVCHPHSPRVRLPAKGRHYEKFKWVDLNATHRLGISSITKRIINHLTLPQP